MSGYKGTYSDFLSYGIYLKSFMWRLAFGFALIGILFLFYSLMKLKSSRIIKGIGIVLCLVIAMISSSIYLKGYISKEKEALITERVSYEKKYRKYQSTPQPTIKVVTSKIDLYPSERAYRIHGNYIIKNTHAQSIDSILISVPEDFEIKSLTYHYKNETLSIDKPISELYLIQSIQPQDSARLRFELTYKWYAVNGHNSFNAIVQNGSFMRISRYFPQFGYDEKKEIQDVNLRAKYGLGKATGIKSLEAPRVKIDDFINLDMKISTPQN